VRGAEQISVITRVGAKYALRTAPDQRTGLRVAAWAIRHRLVHADNAAGHTTARVYLGAIPQITDDTVSVLLKRCGIGGDTVLSRLATTKRTQLADALDAAAATLPTR